MPKRSWIASTSVKVRIRSFQIRRLDPSVGPCADHEEQVIHLAVHREDAQRDRRMAGSGAATMRPASASTPASPSQVSPLQVAARDDLQLVVLQVLAPRQRQPLLIELLDQRDVAFARGGLGAQIQLGQPAPAHRAQGVPVESGVLLWRVRVGDDVARRWR